MCHLGARRRPGVEYCSYESFHVHGVESQTHSVTCLMHIHEKQNNHGVSSVEFSTDVPFEFHMKTFKSLGVSGIFTRDTVCTLI